ncbi:MAG: right-handed parallel beta-helix repeat-containing protein [Planctomycetes bacterium]|nr:right-handed parallel beta-helix repeat-containing protein [Planctomycetota bacterium]
MAIGSAVMVQMATCGNGLGAGRAFYVDSMAGDDANKGDSPALAWASLERANHADLRPGDTVRFKRGGVWRGTLLPQSGEEGKPVTYTSYGEGEKPLLLGSVARSKPSDWTRTGENVWATAKPTWTPKHIIMDLRRTDWGCHREKDAKISTRMQESEAGRALVVECQASGSRGNYIQAWGPEIDWGKVGDFGFMLLRFRARCTKPFRIGPIRVLRSGRPWTTYASAGPAGPEIGTEWKDYGVRLRIHSMGEMARLHISLGGVLPPNAVFEFQPLELAASECSEQRLLDVDVGNIIFDHGKACGWKRWKIEDVKRPYDYFYDGKDMRVFVCSEKNPAEAHSSIELALRRHIIDQGGKHDIVYDGLALKYGAAHGFGGGSTARLIIRNCDLSYIGGGHQFTTAGGRPVRFGNAIEFWGACRDNLVERCRIWEVYDAALTNQGRGPKSIQENITYRNNIISNCEYSFEYWNNPETARTRNIRFINNTCVDAGVVWSHAQRPNPNGSHLMFYSNRADSEGIEIKYNIFYNSTEWGSRYSAGWKPLPDMDYNAWYVPVGELCYFFREHIKGDDVEGYRKKTGLDRHSFFGDPKLVDPKNGDYRLAPDSPVRNLRPDGGPMGASF